MMTEIYNAFRCQPFSAPSGSVPATLTITAAPTSVEGENATNTANEALFLTLRGSIPLMRTNPEVKMMTSPSIIQLTDTTLVFPNSHDDAKIELIGSSSNIQLVDTTLVIPSLRSDVALTILTVPGIHVTKTTPPEPQVPQRKGKGIATDEQLEAPTKLANATYVVRPDLDALIKIAYEIHGKLYNLTKDEIQEHQNKEEKLKKAKEALMTKTALIKVVHEKAKKIGLDPKTIKSAKGGEQFKKVRIPFKFTDFRVNELDELGPIIQKKKNRTVKALMLSLGKRYERLKNIPKELGIQSALPAPAPEQAISQSSGRNKKHMELEHEIRIPVLECDASLPEEESEDEIFEAGDEMDEEVQPTNEEETHSPSPNKEQPESSRAQDTESDSDSSCPKVLKKYDNWEKHKEAVASYVDLKSKIKRFHDAAYKVQPVSLSYSHSSKALIFRD
ncbi:hypothetical protein Tco_0699399 [Tanacetum coccineum]